ncbi:MFS transporter [Saxibacter everestensis]|uniref:MFS transporter n=1 Tax=Saxibacter everestensis TaxID=2909229 RepID=A0ABY8QW60_9MICO|nr:MFS transporter [Brevibacteriaceae bacterium ZFBP1038]
MHPFHFSVSTFARNRLALAAVLLASLAFPLTITGAALALPGIQRDLAATLPAAQWVVNGYNTCFAAFLTFAGSLADLLGRRRLFSAGIVLFLVGSLSCVLADDILLLNAARAVAGLGAAAAVATGSSILAASFQGSARTRAFGALGTVLGIGLAFGPTVSGFLVTALGWRSVFALPAVLSGLVLVLCPLLPRLPGLRGRRIDWLGGALFTSSLIVLIVVFVVAPSFGIGSLVVIGGMVAALVLGSLFVLVERRVSDPMFDLGLLGNRTFAGLTIVAGTMMGVLVPLLVYLPSYLIDVIGLEADQAGLWLLMLTVPSVVLPSVGAMIARRSVVLLVSGSAAVSGAGVLLLATIGADSTAWQLFAPLLLTGVGVGLTTGVIDGLAISGVDAKQAGTAAGLFNTGRLTAETIALAVVGSALAAISGGHLAGTGFSTALRTVSVALGVLALLVAGGVAVLLARGRRGRAGG